MAKVEVLGRRIDEMSVVLSEELKQKEILREQLHAIRGVATKWMRKIVVERLECRIEDLLKELLDVI